MFSKAVRFKGLKCPLYLDPNNDNVEKEIALFSCSVEPVFNDHPWEVNNLVFVHSWSFIAGSFRRKMINWESKSGCYRQGIAIQRWSLAQV